MSDENYLPSVKAQYEALPYPERDPADEKKRLLKTSLDYLPRINHICFSGKQTFSQDFRVLVAGGGTGDAAIYLADQLRDSDARVLYVDLSSASMAIAQERARIRKLDNIDWLNISLLELDPERHGTFDYINCSGVLHHLADPVSGIHALKSVLKQDGAMGLMVYATYGRTGVYQIQELMKYVNTGIHSDSEKILNTRLIIDNLPGSNWFKRAEELHTDHVKYGDIGLYDLFLHSQDRSYTIPELLDWLNTAELEFIDFANSRLQYEPARYIQDSVLLKLIRKKSLDEQYAIAELVTGDIIKHTFYCAKQEKETAEFEQNMYMIFSDPDLLEQIQSSLSSLNDGDEIQIKPHGMKISIPVNAATRAIFQYVDGQHNVANILDVIEKQNQLPGIDRESLSELIAQLFDILIRVDLLYLSENPYPPVKK